MKAAKFSIFCLFLGVALLQAAIPEATPGPVPVKEKPPVGPLLKRATDFSTWRIAFSYTRDKQKAKESEEDMFGEPEMDFLPQPIRKITLTRTRPRWVAVIEDIKGNKIEQCSDGFHEYVSTGASAEASLISRGPTIAVLLPNFGSEDFPDMEVVTSDNFKGVQPLGDRRCMLFSDSTTAAWIDFETRMPLLWKRGAQTRTFQQIAPPTRMIELPQSVKKVSEALKKDRDRLSKSTPRGG